MALAAVVLMFDPVPAASKVVRVEIESRSLVLGGRPFGNAGSYERLVGRIYFAFDPENPHNAQIVDLALAPTNADGLVEAWAEFMVLQPVEIGRRRDVAWIEVPNRGGKASLRYFQGAESTVDPVREEHFGDGLLMRQGLTLIWVGWQPDIPDREGLLRLVVPTARRPSGGDVEGLVRADWTVDEAAETLGLGHRGHRAYPVARADDPANVLTVRDGREAPREVVPRESWRFLTSVPGSPPDRIGLQGGFEAGRIYELVYQAKNPWLVGLGPAAIRDVASYAKYDLGSEFPVRQVVGFGVSQTGRFLRHFLYQGFNVDEAGLKAFDGLLIHTAGGGRGSFNHRFAQPSRDAHRYSAFFYPTDLFPFSSQSQRDPVTGRSAGLLDTTAEEHRPLTFFTNTGYEYWGRAASLIHTSPDGSEDVEPLPTERIYHLAGGQHSVGGFPPDSASRIPGSPAVIGNPLDFFVTLRSLALRLVAWVADGEVPPQSSYPRLADGTLVPVGALAFPQLPGVDVPAVTHVAYRADYGSRFESEGIVERQPPQLGEPFVSLVPQVDGLGNELGGSDS
ncbi:MAG: alpha/beta hydrolase domain-containing protein, partial [Gemmatimonadota bacterium]|nr:alpha/beta hydrolase domain-containing protein [Gemmatimonadota bacterium]